MARLSSTITTRILRLVWSALEENLPRKIRRLDFWHWNLTLPDFSILQSRKRAQGQHYGSFNTALGRQALLVNISGVHNTATGAHAMSTNTTGKRQHRYRLSSSQSKQRATKNTATGFDSLQSNTSGIENTAPASMG